MSKNDDKNINDDKTMSNGKNIGDDKGKSSADRYHGHDPRDGKSLSEMNMKNEIRRHAEADEEKKDVFLEKTVQEEKNSLDSFGHDDSKDGTKDMQENQSFGNRNKDGGTSTSPNGENPNIGTDGGHSGGIEDSNSQQTDKLSAEEHSNSESLQSETKKSEDVKSTDEKPKAEKFGLDRPKQTPEQAKQYQQQRNQQIYNEEHKQKDVYKEFTEKTKETAHKDIPEQDEIFDNGTADAIDGEYGSSETSDTERKNLQLANSSSSPNVKNDDNVSINIDTADNSESTKLTEVSSEKSKNVETDDDVPKSKDSRFGDRERPNEPVNPNESNNSPESQQARNRQLNGGDDEPKAKETIPDGDLTLEDSSAGTDLKNDTDNTGDKLQVDDGSTTENLKPQDDKAKNISAESAKSRTLLTDDDRRGIEYTGRMNQAIYNAQQNAQRNAITVRMAGVNVTVPGGNGPTAANSVGSGESKLKSADSGDPYGGKMFRVKASAEKREKIARAMQDEIATGVRVFADATMKNGGEVGAGLRTADEYRRYSILLASVPLALFIKGLKTEQWVRAKAEFQRASLELGKTVKNSAQYLRFMNESLSLSGVNGIKIPTGATGNKLIAIVNRHIKQTKRAMRLGQLTKEQGDRILVQLRRTRKMGKLTMFKGKGRFRISGTIRSVFSIATQKIAKNGGDVGAGLSMVLRYKRMALTVTRKFIRHVKRTGRVSALLARKAWIKAVQVATDRVNAGIAGRVATKIFNVNGKINAARESLQNAVNKSVFGRGKAFLKKFSPKNIAKNVFGFIGKRLKGTRVGKQVVKLGKKISNSLAGRIVKGFFKGISNIFSAINYGLYTLKKWVFLGLSSAVAFILVIALFMSMFESAVQAFNFAANKQKDQETLTSALNKLYNDDVEYMTSGVKSENGVSTVNKITFSYDKDVSLYEDKLKDIVSKSQSKKKEIPKQTLNVAEILAMTYVRFDYDFKHAKYTPVTTNTGTSDLYDTSGFVSASDVGNVNVSSGGGISVNNNAKFALAYLMANKSKTKLTNAGIAGIMANISAETTSFNPTEVNSIGAFGLCQWLGGRKTNVKNYINKHCSNKNSTTELIKAELDFMLSEMNTNGSYKKTIQTLKSTNDPYTAGKVMCENFERPGGNQPTIRGNKAKLWYAQSDLSNLTSSYMGGSTDTTLTAPGVTADNSTASDATDDTSSDKSDTADSADPGDATATQLTGMKAVTEYAKELWYGSHIINVYLNDSDDSDDVTADIDYKTIAFGSLFSQPRATSQQINVVSDASMNSGYGEFDFGDATAQDKAYYLLRKVGGFSHEAACGIMGNIEVESDWDPTAKTGKNIGLFQNSDDELKAMKEYCSENCLDFNTVEGQMLSGIYSLDAVSMPNYAELKSRLTDGAKYSGEDGAKKAADDWCAVYERCKGTNGNDKAYEGTFSGYSGNYQGLADREKDAATYYQEYLQYKDNLGGLGITESSDADASALMVDGIMQVPYCSQASGWLDGNSAFSTEITFGKEDYGTMQHNGCSLCSAAMIMSYCTGKRYNPNSDTIKKYFEKARNLTAYNVAHDLGLTAKRMGSNDTKTVISELKKGHPIYTHMKSGTAVSTDGTSIGNWASSGGHYIVIIGYKKVNNKDAVCLADPGKRERAYAVGKKWFYLSEIKKYLRTDDKKPFTSVTPSASLMGTDSTGATLAQNTVIAYCKKKVGCDYKYGACHSESEIRSDSTNKFDCSGYANWVFTHATGKLYNNSSSSWANAGKAIDVHDLQAGDLLVRTGGKTKHVAIYAGNNKMYEAPHSGAKVHLTDYSNSFNCYRRIVTSTVVAGSFGSSASSGNGVLIRYGGKTKKYTSRQFVAQIKKLSILGTPAHYCGRWTARAWGAMLYYGSAKKPKAIDKVVPSFATLGAKSATAYTKCVTLHKTSDTSSIPVGADVLWTGGNKNGDGHIGIYIGDGQYISNLRGGSPEIRNVFTGGTGLGSSYHFAGWGWHTLNGKQVVSGC